MIDKVIRWIQLWFISSRKAHCDCVWTEGGRIYYRPSSLIEIDMWDITVDGIELLECTVCKCKFIFSKHGVAKCSAT